MKHLIQRISLLMLLSAAMTVLCSASKSLNQGYLVPSGKTRIDQQLLGSELKVCALTFDDGPDVRYTMQVHDILREQGIRATFFVVGRSVDRYPEQVIALAEYGHEIANHSYSHRDMLTLSKADIREELQKTSESLTKLGITPHWFRPPYGSFNRTVVNLAAEEGLDTMLWSVDPQDWMRPGSDVIRRRIVNGCAPGAVLLMHSTVGQTVDALPEIIADLREQGYRFVTASEWQQLVSGAESLDSLQPLDGYSLPLNLMDDRPLGSEQARGSGILGGGLPADADVWQRVPAGLPGNAPRKLTVYANFADDNDLRRVLIAGNAEKLMETDSAVGNGLRRVLDGLPPQQIVAVVDEPGDRRDARGSVEVQIIDAPVLAGNELLASAAQQASDEAQTGMSGEAVPAIRLEEPAGPVALGNTRQLSFNLAGSGYADSLSADVDTSHAFVSFASSPDATDWRWLATYMKLCGLSGFGYAEGYSPGKAPADFQFADATSQQGRKRLELGMFNPARYLSQLASAEQRFIPLRSTDFSALAKENLFGGVSNGYREFMLIRHFSAGLPFAGAVDLPGLAAGQQAALFTDGQRSTLIIASPRPGITLTVPEQYLDWQQVNVDGEGRVESSRPDAAISEAGRLLIMVHDGSD